MIRNIIGQPKSTFNIRKIMDEGKILVVNLSRGLMGEDNAGILGAMMVTKIQLAAMGRADVPMEERRPFYLYVDEFQNFATDSFATILSEARKYGLNLTVANQYISQMSEEVRSAVFGNVGSIICFRISPDDAPFMQKYFEPQFEAADLIQQHSRFFVTTMMINDEKAPAFSAKTLNLPQPQDDLTSRIISLSRERYATDRVAVEELVRKNAGLAIDNQPQPQPAKPHAQGQLRRVETIANDQTHNEQLGRMAASLLSNAGQTDESMSSEDKPAKRRRRGKRGGRKNKAKQAEAIIISPAKAAENDGSHEEVIRLR
jgi:hypothetical protein